MLRMFLAEKKAEHILVERILFEQDVMLCFY